MQLLTLSNVSRSYDVDGHKHKVLDNFSYVFPEKGLVGIIGKSGSGKSTLLNLMALLDKPSEGEILFLDKNIHRWNNKRKILYRQNDIGMIFQHHNLIENETVIYNIMLPYLIRGGRYKQAYMKANQLLDSISFRHELFEQKVYNLSGGEKQRVAILRALINEPKIIFADEPTGALDSNNSVVVMKCLKKISEEKLVVVVSHNLPLINKFTNHIIALKDGKLYEKK